MTNSKAKGGRGERELAEFLRSFGHEAHRSQQYCGVGEDASDVISTTLPSLHFECKRTENLSLYPAMEQAIRDAEEGKIPVVAHRRSRKDWLAITRLEDFIKLFPGPENKTPVEVKGSTESESSPINKGNTDEKEN